MATSSNSVTQSSSNISATLGRKQGYKSGGHPDPSAGWQSGGLGNVSSLVQDKAAALLIKSRRHRTHRDATTLGDGLHTSGREAPDSHKTCNLCQMMTPNTCDHKFLFTTRQDFFVVRKVCTSSTTEPEWRSNQATQAKQQQSIRNQGPQT